MRGEGGKAGKGWKGSNEKLKMQTDRLAGVHHRLAVVSDYPTSRRLVGVWAQTCNSV